MRVQIKFSLLMGCLISLASCAPATTVRGDARLTVEPGRSIETPLWRLTLPAVDVAQGSASFTIADAPAKRMYVVLVTDDSRAVDEAAMRLIDVVVDVTDSRGRRKLAVGGPLHANLWATPTKNETIRGWHATWTQNEGVASRIHFYPAPNASTEIRFDPAEAYRVDVRIAGSPQHLQDFSVRPEFRWQSFAK